jgi:hypothetical protein
MGYEKDSERKLCETQMILFIPSFLPPHHHVNCLVLDILCTTVGSKHFLILVMYVRAAVCQNHHDHCSASVDSSLGWFGWFGREDVVRDFDTGGVRFIINTKP